jgi:hypothetical protein
VAEVVAGAALDATVTAIGAAVVTLAVDQLNRAFKQALPASGYQGPLIPTAGPRPNAEEDRAVQEAGGTHGCMTCGSPSPGTASGRWIRNHVPPTAVKMPGEQQYLGPHCQTCSDRQGGFIRQMLRRIKDLFTPGNSGPTAQTPVAG